MVFLLFSDFFNGKVDASRQTLTLSKTEFIELQKLFRKAVTKLIEENIPKIKKRHNEIKESLIWILRFE